MILTEDTSSSEYQIRAYKPGAITVNDKTYTKSLIISAHDLILDWPPQSLAELHAEDLNKILALKPEIVILGTGKRFTLPPQAQLAPLYQARLGVECMDTGAACRTYTALMSEGRRVIAALLIN
jgi:uncharacterized protein